MLVMPSRVRILECLLTTLILGVVVWLVPGVNKTAWWIAYVAVLVASLVIVGVWKLAVQQRPRDSK